MHSEIVLQMQGITKTFPGVMALHEVGFDLRHGEVHGLVGENGAGKSTLIKILGGAYLPDGGSIEIGGRPAVIQTPRDALRHGVSIIYQEFNLVPTLSVAENIFLGKELAGGLVRSLNRRAMIEKSHETLTRLGMKDLNAASVVRTLSVAQQQMVEIGKALFNNAAILVMDEPTSVLSQKESEALFELMRGLKAQGISIIFISHRLDEVIDLCDRITVLRDGEHVCTLDNGRQQVTKDDLVRHMVGRELNNYYPERKLARNGEKLLSVKGLSSAGLFRDISFELYKGEILGFYGLVGSGRTEIMKSIFGTLELDAGEITLGDRPIKIRTVKQASDFGMALVPEDRKREGLVLKMSLGDNICLPNLDEIHTAGTIHRRKKRELVNRYVDSMSIRPALPNRLAKDFSGGNQQKAVIAKWLASNPKIIIFDEPTRGIDVGAKSEIYHLIARLAETGVGVIFVSSELLEVIGMCDRVMVIHEGRMTGEFGQAEATQEKLMQAAAGF